MREPLTRREALLDVAWVVVAVAVAWAVSRFWLYPALRIADTTPVILRPISGFFAALWRLRVRGYTTRDVGLVAPSSWPRAALATLGFAATSELLTRHFVPWLATRLHAAGRPGVLSYVRGNTGAFLVWLTIGVVVGGFCEEVLFRGFLLARVASFFGARRRLGLAAGLVGQALFFGALHLYGGPRAMVNTATFAVAAGTFYLASGRTLWPLIVVHAATNAIGFWSLYRG